MATEAQVKQYLKEHEGCKPSDVVNHFAGPPQDWKTAKEVKEILLKLCDQKVIEYGWRWETKILKPW